MPNMQRQTDSVTRSAVVASINIARLCDTADAITGDDLGFSRLEERLHSIDMRRQREIFPAFQQLCGLIDVTSSTPPFAHVLGIEDAFYRWTVYALALQPLDSNTVSYDVREVNRIDVVCDLVRSAHERPLTLTEMERVSGLSARALQYAFKARFGCSPMEWQRRERMQLAHRRLLFGVSGETITQIAYAMGYSSSAAFSAQYRKYFGETPSQAQRHEN